MRTVAMFMDPLLPLKQHKRAGGQWKTGPVILLFISLLNLELYALKSAFIYTSFKSRVTPLTSREYCRLQRMRQGGIWPSVSVFTFVIVKLSNIVKLVHFYFECEEYCINSWFWSFYLWQHIVFLKMEPLSQNELSLCPCQYNLCRSISKAAISIVKLHFQVFLLGFTLYYQLVQLLSTIRQNIKNN